MFTLECVTPCAKNDKREFCLTDCGPSDFCYPDDASCNPDYDGGNKVKPTKCGK